MRPAALHGLLRLSVQRVISRSRSGGLRFILESGGSEAFLRDLLAIALESAGYRLSRELRARNRYIDLVVHGNAEDVLIEAKQLHLKDGARYAVNVLRDLQRHRGKRALGAVYVVDGRRSTYPLTNQKFEGANRTSRRSPQDVLEGLEQLFPVVFPRKVRRARLRRFSGYGSIDLYAFVVACGN
jgi:hypothetical protein